MGGVQVERWTGRAQEGTTMPMLLLTSTNRNAEVNLFRKSICRLRSSTMGATLGQHRYRIMRLKKKCMKKWYTLVWIGRAQGGRQHQRYYQRIQTGTLKSTCSGKAFTGQGSQQWGQHWASITKNGWRQKLNKVLKNV